jgi:hypothetical protein
MELNLRILQSLKKINENIKNNEEKQEKTNKKIDESLKGISKEIKEIENENEDLKKELFVTIEKVKQEKPKDGENGKDGRDGKDGYTPIKGKDYFDGKDGVDGVDGKNGKDGKDGKDGRNGLDGRNGTNGKDGVGIYNIEINNNGELIITLTNGVKKNCGVVVGRDGFGYNGNDGVSVTDAKIIDGELIITLSTGRKINAGKVTGESSELVESDPVFTQSPAGSITSKNIESWNNKVEDENYVHTDNNFTDEDKEQITTNKEDILKLNEEVEKITPKEYYIKINTDIVLEETNMTYESITKDIEGNRPFVCYLEYGIQKFDMQLMRISEYEGITYYEFMGIVRNGINQLIFWFYIREDETTQIELVTDAPMVFHAELNPDGTIATLDATYVEILHAMNSGKDVLLKATWQGETIHMSLGEWKAQYTPPYFSFYGMVRNGLEVMEFFIHVGENGQHTFSDVRTYQMKDEKVQSVVANSNNQATYPTTFAVFNEFMRKPDIIYSDPTGFEATNDGVDGSWYLTGLDLSKYKRLKFYVSANGTSNDNYTPSHIVEMHLDERAKKYKDAYTAGHASQNPNNRNRIHFVSFAVSGDKTAIQFIHAMSLYGTAGSDSSGGRTCYLIEGYYD